MLQSANPNSRLTTSTLIIMNSLEETPQHKLVRRNEQGAHCRTSQQSGALATLWLGRFATWSTLKTTLRFQILENGNVFEVPHSRLNSQLEPPQEAGYQTQLGMNKLFIFLESPST
jgi:hypothetical protein